MAEPQLMNLDLLAQAHANHCNLAAGYATSTHAGVAAVLRMVAADARCTAVGDLSIYDQQLLKVFAAKLEKIAAPR